MVQSRTHNCNELNEKNAGERVRIVGWMQNLREVSNSLAFLVLRDFYGITQVVVEDAETLQLALIHSGRARARAILRLLSV